MLENSLKFIQVDDKFIVHPDHFLQLLEILETEICKLLQVVVETLGGIEKMTVDRLQLFYTASDEELHGHLRFEAVVWQQGTLHNTSSQVYLHNKVYKERTHAPEHVY